MERVEKGSVTRDGIEINTQKNSVKSNSLICQKKIGYKDILSLMNEFNIKKYLKAD